MLGFIYRLVRGFERENGIHPNLLYLNEQHARSLREGFSEEFTLQMIMDFLQMDLVINRDVVHPQVIWRQSAQRQAV